MYRERFTILRKAYERFKEQCLKAKSTLDKGLPVYKKFENFIMITKTGLRIMLCLCHLKNILTRNHGANGTKT